ncbi:MAG: TonB-dependent receptor domain-containing protein [Porticoccaceae bacterium]
MTKKWFGLLTLLTFFMVPKAFSEDAFVLVFLEDSPLRHIKVAVDGEIVGVTDGKGLVKASIEPGPHKLYLITDDDAIPVRFDLPKDSQIEVSAVFYRDEALAPVVKKQIFESGSTATGYIAGVVTSPSGLPVKGATVEVTDLGIYAETDEEGIYSLELPRGMHDLQVSRSGYQPSAITPVRVFADLGVNARFKLIKKPSSGIEIAPPSFSMEEVVTVGVFNPTEGAENIERYATSIVSAIDAEQLDRFGDSDVAAVLGRIVGLTVTEDKFANVRGLDGRYISTNFNGIIMPSTDPLRRDVQLDLFPANIVDSIEVQKSFSADQLATTTGGSIRVNTKGLPDGRVGKVSVSTGVNADFTGDDVQGYRDSNTEWLGYDNGLRDIHSGVLEATEGATSLTICDPRVADICTRPEVAMAYALTFKPDYDVEPITADPDVGLDVNFGDRFEYANGEVGYYIAGTYGRSTSSRGDAVLSNPNGLNGVYNRTKDNVAVSGYGVVGYEFDSGEIISKTTLLRSTDDVTRQSLVTNVEGNDLDAVILEYVQRQLFSQNLTGLYEFQTAGLDSSLDYRLGYSETDRLEPDRRQYYSSNDSLAISSVERRWSDLNEVSEDFAFDYSVSSEWGDSSYLTLSAGAMSSNKERTVDLYRFGFRIGDDPISLNTAAGVDALLSVPNLAADAFRLRTATAATDSYASIEETLAYYVKVENEFGEDWTAEVGARFEDFSQEILYPGVPENNGLLETDGWYPAINISWRATEELQFRLGYSQTVSYPGLIERSDSQSYDPSTDDPIFGKADLQVSEIDNLDLRLEYYFGESSRASLAIFKKDIDKPIERAIPDASGSAAAGITFRNQNSAQLDGIEIDFNTLIVDTDVHGLFLNGNLSYIDSSVVLGPRSLQLEGETSNGRPLQGQSEYLANLQIGYDHYPTEQKLTLLFNYFDDRIFRVARGAAIGPLMEGGRLLVDLNYENILSDAWIFKVKVKNLTNEPISYSQNEREIEAYKTGTTISASLSYEF